MSVLVLQCSVCHANFETRRAWISHLLQPYHQNQARKEICRWGQPERECVLVAFTNFPIASSDQLLQFFSRGTMNLVTDFVWFKTRPHIGFLQFESKHKVEEILSNFPGPEIRLSNQLVQIKKAGECLRLEWQQLIPFQNVDELLEDPEEVEKVSPSPGITPTPFTNIDIPNQIKQEEEDVPQVQMQKEVGPPQPNQLLVNHYHSICEAIEIPNDEYNMALSFIESLRSKFGEKCKIIWFRNWYLKLKNASDMNELILFVDTKGTFPKEGLHRLRTLVRLIP